MMQGKSGITKIDKWDTHGYSTQFAGEIKQLDVSKYVNKKMARRLDDVIKYTIVAGKKVQQPDAAAYSDASTPSCILPACVSRSSSWLCQ